MGDVPKGLQMFSATPVAMGMQVLPAPAKFRAEIPGRRYSTNVKIPVTMGRREEEPQRG